MVRHQLPFLSEYDDWKEKQSIPLFLDGPSVLNKCPFKSSLKITPSESDKNGGKKHKGRHFNTIEWKYQNCKRFWKKY